MPIALIAIVILVVAAAIGYFNFMPTADSVDQPLTEEVSRPQENEMADETELEAEPNDTSADDTVDAEAAVAVDAEAIDPEIETLPPGPVAEVPAEVATEYVDGTYTVTTSYLTPRRVEHVVDLEFTIENDVVVAVSALYDGAAPETSHHTRFDNALAGEVVGVPLNDLAPSRIGGASLTTDAFNDAVEEVRAEAASA